MIHNLSFIVVNKEKIKQNKQLRRKNRVRAKISGTDKRPRLSASRSNRYMYLQLVNDEKNETIASVHSKKIDKKGNKVEISFEAGKLIAAKAKENNIKEIVFDRGGRKYHGRVKAVAEGIREEGIIF